jgi:hypothetical protein
MLSLSKQSLPILTQPHFIYCAAQKIFFRNTYNNGRNTGFGYGIESDYGFYSDDFLRGESDCGFFSDEFLRGESDYGFFSDNFIRGESDYGFCSVTVTASNRITDSSP